MCYYSRALHPNQFRDAKLGEDLTIVDDGRGHIMGYSEHDHKIVCMRNAEQVHIEKLVLNPHHERAFLRHFPQLRKYVKEGLPVSGQFLEGRNKQLSADQVMIDGHYFSFAYLGEGTVFYLGPKKIPIETKLGVDDPSIVLDHKTVDETPTTRRTWAQALGLCSITR
jgi:hypothetical protein